MSRYVLLTALVAIGVLAHLTTQAQTGPGGVGDATSNRFWFDANDLSGTLSDNAAVSAWANKGGNANNASQGTGGNQPTFQSDASSTINGFPVIRFDGSNDFLAIADNSDLNTGTTDARSFFVTVRTSSDITTRQVIYEEGGQTRGIAIYIFDGDLYLAAWNLANDGTGSPWGFFEINTSITANTEYIIGFVKNGNSTSTGTIDGYLNGTNFGTINNVGRLYPHSADIAIGAKNGSTFYETGGSSGTGDYFNGDVAEFIHYNLSTNTAERILIENYLSAKYNIALAANDVYLMDNPGNGDFDNEAAGIGQASDGTSNIDGQGPSIVRANSASALSNNEFLIWGHDGAALSESPSNVPTGIDYRLERIWRASHQGNVGTVTLSFDVSSVSVSGGAATDFFLLVDGADTDFSNATSTVANSFGSNVVTFNGVTLNDGDHFTLGVNTTIVSSGNTGPGGVLSTDQYRFWWDANDLTGTLNDGDVTNTWTNKGGNSTNATTSGGNSPAWRNAAGIALNEYPVWRMDGSNDHWDIANNTDLNLAAVNDEYTFSTVIRTGSDVSTRQVVYEEGGTVRGLNIYISNGDLYVGAWNLNNDGAGAPWGYFSINTPVSANTAYVVSFVYDGNSASTGTLEGYLNGSNFGTISNVGLLYQHAGLMAMGAKQNDSYYETGSSGGNGQFFNGDLAEFINYNLAINDARRIIVENYLAAKYGIALTANDQYAMDDNANGDHDHQVAGIGRISSGVEHTDAKGEGIVRMYLPSSLGNNEYLLWGHDDEILCNSENVPGGLTNRLTRLWRVSEVGDVGTVNVTFDMTGITYGNINNLQLLVDADGDFSNATAFPLNSNSGDVALFTGVSFNDGDYFTVATTDFFEDGNASSTTWNGGSTDWYSASNWSDGVPDSLQNAIISSGASTMPTIGSAGARCRSLTIESGATLTIAGANDLTVYGSWTNNGTFVENQSTVTILNTCVVCDFNTSSTQRFYNLTINTGRNARVSSGSVEIQSSLTLTNGTFETNSALTLLSNPTETARIPEITGGNITGDVVIQRYIDAGETQWRFHCFAVSGADFEQMDDDFITSGIPGSDFPNFPFASFLQYDETLPGSQADGFVTPASMSVVPGVGEGFWVWSGDTSSGTQPFTVDYVGPVNTGTINLPVTFTPSGGAGEDGWNMTGNPYPCTIDWDAAAWTRTSVADAVYIWNPETAGYASYIAGVGTDGGSRFIASSQAFMVEATTNAPSPILTITEACKVDQDAAFVKSNNTPEVFRLQVSDGATISEAVLRFEDDATDGYDYNYDARKIIPFNQVGPVLSSAWNGIDYAINALETPTGYIEVPFKVLVPTSGTFTLTATDLTAVLGETCVLLEDLQTGQITDLLVDSSYTFTETPATTTARFLLKFSPEQQVMTTDVSCSGSADATIVASSGHTGIVDFTWTDLAGSVLHTSSGNAVDSLTNLSPGTYIISSTGTMAQCTSSIDTVVIVEPAPLSVQTTSTGETCDGCCDGLAEVIPAGGTAPYAYLWDDASTQTTSMAAGLCAGTYLVEVTDANGCSELFQVDVNLEVGLDELTANETFSLWPNPATDQVNLTNALNVNSTVVLINAVGQQVWSGTVNQNASIPLNGLASGVYSVILSNEKGQWTQRLVIR